jgi:hypothetical protein
MSINNAFNNNPEIIGFDIPVHDDNWFKFRTIGIEGYEGGFGASEIATICGKTSPTYGKILPVLLNEKAGISTPERAMNEHMLSGILAEPIILERWDYYDGTEKGYLTNYLNNRKIRNHRTVNMYLVNKKFPWLFASLDAAILSGQGGLWERNQKLDKEHPLECKQLSYFASQTWENKVPPQYIYQINQQMLVTDTDYAELAVLQDGYKFEVYPFKKDESICEEILTKSEKHWKTVLEMRDLETARKYYLDINQIDKADHAQAVLDSMIPEPESGDGWKDFLNDRFVVEKEEFEGGVAEFRQAVKRKKAKMAIAKLETFVSLMDNKMRALFVKNNAEIMSFGKSGKVTYKKVGKRDAPQFNYAGLKRLSEVTDEAFIDEIIEPLIK